MTKTNAERIAVVETKIDNVESKVDGLHLKLDYFIESADNKYAEKERVNKLENNFLKIDHTIARWGGAIAVLVVLGQIGIKLIFG